MQRFFTSVFAALAVFAGTAPAVAEDIDLFVQPPGVAVGLPNVLIVLDNTANWNTKFTNEVAALKSTIQGLPTGPNGEAKYRLGLMLFTETGSPNSNTDGGYVRIAIRDLTADTKIKFVEAINRLDVANDRSNGGKAGKTMAEIYQYFSGLAPRMGNGKVKTDYTGNALVPSSQMTAAGALAANAIYALPGNALNSRNGTPYNSPVQNGSCGGNYVIYISNGAVQDNSSDNTTATTWLTQAAAAAGIAGATTTIPISPSGSQSNVADEWARFMKKSPLRITTYTVDVDKVTTGQGPGWTAMLKSMQSVSDGKYFDVSSGNGGAQVAAALGAIFSEIQAVNSVFASVSLPVSVNTEGTYLNQVYIGMFRPDQDGFARWNGNLKQYKLGIIANELRTLDADGNAAINADTGFITECARSFWTPTTADSYWAFKPQGGCTIGVTNYDNSNYPDGKVVEKGAQAHGLRATTTRVVRTCSSTFGSCSAPGALIDFTAVNVPKGTGTGLGNASMTDAQRLVYVDWMRGQDLEDEDNDAVTTAEMRPSAHGDVVHSRPIAINYGTDATPKVVVYYAGNDGVLRAINGNRSAAIGSVGAGREIWSFVPPEFFSSITRIKDNNVQISYKGNPTTTPTPQPKPYGMDGPITTYQNNSLYVGMRRGGRVYYGFNMTNIVRDPAQGGPVAPRLLWKIGCPLQSSDTDCQSDYQGIGQTWSAAKVIKTNGYKDVSNVPKPMLIFGGGYDPCEDADPVSDTCRSNAKGRQIYVADAATGTRLKKFDTERGVIGDVFIVSDPATGIALWAYAADLGGNVYRISGNDANTPFENTTPGNWTITKIADLGCSSTSACTGNRKFMFMPDIVEKNGTYYLLLGSGDREKPLGLDVDGNPYWSTAYNTSNYFFMVTDTPTDDTWLESENGNCGSDVMCLDSLLEIGDSNPDPDDLAEKKGWYLQLNPNEQVVTSAITVFGTTTFSTHTPVSPVAGQCTSNLGTARVYNIRFLNAAARVGEDRSAMISGGGLPPSPVAGLVTLDDGTTVPFCIGCDARSSLEGKLPDSPSTGTQPKSLTYWYIEK